MAPTPSDSRRWSGAFGRSSTSKSPRDGRAANASVGVNSQATPQATPQQPQGKRRRFSRADALRDTPTGSETVRHRDGTTGGSTVGASGKAGNYQREIYLGSLRSPTPGQWTDNRLEQSQHLTGAVYVAIKVLGDQAAAAKCNVYKLKPDAKSAEDHDAREPISISHPLAQLMRQPNPKETGGMLRRRIVNQLCLTGSSLLWKLDNELDDPAEMWSIPTATTQAISRSSLFPHGAYRVTPYLSYGPWAYFPGLGNVGGVVIPAEEMVRIDFPHPLVQYDAYSPLTACALQFDALEAIDRSRWHGMKQSINPSGVVEVDSSVAFPDQEELDRLKQSFSEKMGGVENVGRLAVMSPGLKLSPWSHSPVDMGWESSWSQLVDFVLSVFGVTKSLAFMSTEGSYASLYASLQQFNLFSLCPLLQLIADTINVQMIWPRFGQEYVLELVPAAINDESLKDAQLKTLMMGKALTKNELRTAYNREPTEEAWGDEIAGEQPQKPGEGEGDGAGDNPLAAMMGGGGADEGDDAGGPPPDDAPEMDAEEAPDELSEGSLPDDDLAGTDDLPPLGKSMTAAGKDDASSDAKPSLPPDAVARIADALEGHEFSEWYVALLMAGMDEFGDADQAIESANEAWEANPEGSESEPSEDDDRFAELLAMRDGESVDPVERMGKSAKYEESKHKRDGDGKFASTGSGSSSKTSGDGKAGGDGKTGKDAGKTKKTAREKVVSAAKKIAAKSSAMSQAVKELASTLTKRGMAAYERRVPPKARAVLRAMSLPFRGLYAAFHAIEAPLKLAYATGQDLAKEVARERGYDDAKVEKLSRVLGVVDGASKWVANIPVLHHGLEALAHIGGPAGFAIAKVGFYLPAASLAYVGYSSARNPLATIRAARNTVRNVRAGKLKAKHGHADKHDGKQSDKQQDAGKKDAEQSAHKSMASRLANAIGNAERLTRGAW